VRDGNGADVYRFGGGNDTYSAINGNLADGDDIVDGGKGNGDLYDAFFATNDLQINLDSVAHIDINIIAANTAHGIDVSDGLIQKDTVTGFENVSGGAGHDQIFGNSSANILKGNGNIDDLFGLGGNDQLFGGVGADALVGGKGADIISTGGSDAAIDSIIYTSLKDSTVAAAGRDTIVDFEVGHDLINLIGIDAIKGGNDDAFNFIGVHHFHGTAGELRESFSNGNSIVSGDVDGDGNADFAIKLTGHVLLHSGDFFP
jgi:Ca2+-binding RTX toxin-like protein